MKDLLLTISIFLLTYFTLMFCCLQSIQQGYVGIYKKCGILSKHLAQPGYHFQVPYFESLVQIQTSVRTDTIQKIPCGTSGGTLIYFKKIEVVNRLREEFVYETVRNYSTNYNKFWIRDKIHHEVNVYCSKHTLQQVFIEDFSKLDEALMEALERDLKIWAPGIEIIAVRATKPKIPKALVKGYRDMELAKSELMIATERQKVRYWEEQTKFSQAMIRAQSLYESRLIRYQTAINKKVNSLRIAEIQAKISLAKAKAETKANFAAQLKAVRVQPRFLSKKYLRFVGFRAFTSNMTLVIGSKVPKIITSLADLTKILQSSQQSLP